MLGGWWWWLCVEEWVDLGSGERVVYSVLSRRCGLAVHSPMMQRRSTTVSHRQVFWEGAAVVSGAL